MMKRACPFDANLLRMSKVHLMDHHVDNKALQKIHETTLEKLKNGAKKLLNDDVVITNKPVESTQKAMKQIPLSCFFTNSGPISIAANSKESDSVIEEQVNACCYCDKQLQTLPCKICGDNFCNSCCLVKYSGNAEEFICLSCNV